MLYIQAIARNRL